MTEGDLGRLVLELTRFRNSTMVEVDRFESSRKHATASYERGKAYGLSLAINRLEQLQAEAKAVDGAEAVPRNVVDVAVELLAPKERSSEG